MISGSSFEDAQVYYVMCLEMLLVVDQSTIQLDYLVGDMIYNLLIDADGI